MTIPSQGLETSGRPTRSDELAGQVEEVIQEYHRQHPDLTRAEIEAACQSAASGSVSAIPTEEEGEPFDPSQFRRVGTVTLILAIIAIAAVLASMLLIRRP